MTEIELGGRRVLRVWRFDTDGDEGVADRRVAIGKGWAGDPAPDAPVMFLPADRLGAIVAALLEAAA